MSASPALRLDDVAVDFGDAPGLLPITLDVAAGERFVILGASGAGKTTLLRAVAGLTPLRAGRVWIAPSGGAPRDVTALPPERRDAVYLHQTPTPFAHLSVFENVAFPLRVRRVARAEVERRVRDALALVRMREFAARMPHTLSGGQRHRVTLARAIVARPAVLLLDEPLAALDPSLRDEVREAIVHAQEDARPALVLVTHDLDEAGLLADRVAVLANRRVLQIAPPAELFAHPASLAVARFLGVGVEVPGIIDAAGCFASSLGTWSVALAAGPLPSGALARGLAVAVVRPDALHLGVPGADECAADAAVLGVRHRARQTTVQLRIVRDGFAPAVVEVAVPPGSLPRVGECVHLVADPRAISLFAADA